MEGRRLNEHGDGALVKSTCSTWSPQGGTNVPTVQDEPDDDHEGEEDVEGNRDREVRKAEVDNYGIPDAVVCLPSLLDKHHDAYCYTDD